MYKNIHSFTNYQRQVDSYAIMRSGSRSEDYNSITHACNHNLHVHRNVHVAMFWLHHACAHIVCLHLKGLLCRLAVLGDGCPGTGYHGSNG